MSFRSFLAGLAAAALAVPTARAADPQEVSVEVRVVNMAEATAAALGLNDDGKPQFFDDAQVYHLLEAVQGDRHADVMMAPKLTTFEGQRAVVQVGQQVFIPTGKPDCNQTVHYEAVETGTQFHVKTMVSASNRFVALDFGLKMSELTAAAEKMVKDDGCADKGVTATVTCTREAPGTTTTAAVPDGGTVLIGSLKKVAECPLVDVQHIDTTVVVPDGGTVLLGGIKKVVERPSEYGPPVISKVPYINRLFKTPACSYSRETMVTFVLVTPRVLHEDDAGCTPPCAAAPLPTTKPTPNQATCASPAECERLSPTGAAGASAPPAPSSGEREPPQVGVEVLVLNVSEASAEALGVEGSTPRCLDQARSADFREAVKSLKSDGQIDVLARPQILTLDGQQAEVQIGQLSPTGGPDSHVEIGLCVHVTPTVWACNGFVGLDFGLEMSELTADGLGVNAQQMQSKAVVPDGGTVVVGGMKKVVETRHECKVPLLGDLPYLGRLFTTVGVGHETAVTVIVVTPHVIREAAATGCTTPPSSEVLPAPMPTSEALPEPKAVPNQATYAAPSEGLTLGLNGDWGVCGSIVVVEPRTCPVQSGNLVENAFRTLAEGAMKSWSAGALPDLRHFSCYDIHGVGSRLDGDDAGVFHEPNFAEQLRSTAQPPKAVPAPSATVDQTFLLELFRRGDY
jgi:type II secretory pathway component GspD/PulD (secretin)